MVRKHIVQKAALEASSVTNILIPSLRSLQIDITGAVGGQRSLPVKTILSFDDLGVTPFQRIHTKHQLVVWFCLLDITARFSNGKGGSLKHIYWTLIPTPNLEEGFHQALLRLQSPVYKSGMMKNTWYKSGLDFRATIPANLPSIHKTCNGTSFSRLTTFRMNDLLLHKMCN